MGDVSKKMDELEMKVEKYSRGKGADLKALRDKKLKGQLAVKEKLYGQSAKAAAKAEKVPLFSCMLVDFLQRCLQIYTWIAKYASWCLTKNLRGSL